MCEIRKLSSISRFEHESQKKVASLPILALDSRSRFSDLAFHSQLWSNKSHWALSETIVDSRRTSTSSFLLSWLSMWLPPILLCVFVGHFETVHCFVPSIHHYSLWVELLPYVQPRGLLPDIQGVCCHSCHSHLSFTAGAHIVHSFQNFKGLSHVFSPPVLSAFQGHIRYFRTMSGLKYGWLS